MRRRVVVAREDSEHRRQRRDERQRAVFEFGGGEPLGVLVGYLLELQRAFEGDGVGDPAADEEVGVGVLVPLGDFRAADSSRTSWTWPGRSRSALMTCRASPVEDVPSASRFSAASCEAKVLVAATPISGPARIAARGRTRGPRGADDVGHGQRACTAAAGRPERRERVCGIAARVTPTTEASPIGGVAVAYSLARNAWAGMPASRNSCAPWRAA